MCKERHRLSWPVLGLALAALFALVALVGCEAPAADACEADDDCFRGEICQAGRCQSIILINNAGSPDAGDEQPDSGGGTDACHTTSGDCDAECDDDSDCPEADGMRGICRVGECILAPPLMSVAAGAVHSCALKSAGEIECWGTTPGDQHAQGQADPPPGTFIEVTAGYYHSCALTGEGNVVCWGDNSSGQAPAEEAGDFIQISAGDFHTCAVTRAGDVKCWGSDMFYQDANRDGDFVQVSAGASHTCALRRDGGVDCWGASRSYDGSHPLSSINATFTQISAGDGFGCGITTSGAIECWGSKPFGREEVEIWPEPIGRFARVAAGSEHACAIYAGTGAVKCWGSEGSNAADEEGSFTEVSAGGLHNCARTSLGGVKCWGSDIHGQLSP